MTPSPAPARVSDAQARRSAAFQSRRRLFAARRAESYFARQLRAVAKNIGNLVDTFAPGGHLEDESALRSALDRYSEVLRPWATQVVRRMQAEVDTQDEKLWRQRAREAGKQLKQELKTTARTGAELQGLLKESVDLISSLPREAAERVHRLTTRSLYEGTRPAEIAEQIMKQGQVSKSKAMLIARTETARTASGLTMARAKQVGATHYIWRTAGDSDVRERHAKLEGKVFAWDDPPVAGENGERANAGMIYNCRCVPEPIIPEDY